MTEKTGDSVIACHYDANGNLVKQSGSTDIIYTYDVYNRLTAYQQGEKKEIYTYDAEGVRRSKTTGTDSVYFVSDTRGDLSQTLAETDGEGNVKAEYTRAGSLTAQVRAGEVSYYLYDGHGDVRALLNEAGRITDKYRYNAYGELLEKEGDTENHYLYTGEHYDGTSNLYYLRARYMNPDTGTFISMDSYEGSIYDPDTLHKYLYANGNPVTYSDPSGNMFDLSSTTMGMGIQNIINNKLQICYRGVISGLINMILTAVSGGSFKDAMSSFVTGFALGVGISAIRYFVVGAELVTLARFYVLSASANFIFSTTMTIFAITQGYSELAVMFSVMAVLSIAEWCWVYGNYLRMDVYGNRRCATIECDPSGGSESGSTSPKGLIGHDFEDYLTQNIGGDGSFSVGGREFDGGIGNRWWEAKSGKYWDMLENDPSKLAKFKSDMGDRLRIATENGATYELFSNTPIPDSIKLWLSKKGITYTELLD